jgi:arylsulfatase A-like enzyme
MTRLDTQNLRLPAAMLVAAIASLVIGATSRAAPPLRLLEPAAGTTLETPALPALAPLQDLPSSRRSVLAESFTPSRPPRLGGLRSVACDIIWRSDGKGPALRYERRAPYRCGLLVAATPSTLYRVERQLSTFAPDVDLVVVETRYPLLDSTTPNQAEDVARLLSKRWVRRDATVAVHRFPRELPQAGWERSTILFATMPATRSLVLLVADQELEEATTPVTALFDDILVDILRPTPAEEVAIYRSMGVAPFDAGRGLLHRGPVTVGTTADVTDPARSASLRTTLFAPTQVALGLGAPVPANATLTVDYGPHPATRADASVAFSVRVQPEAGEALSVWSARVVSSDAWHTARVELGAFVGQRIGITLATVGATTDSDLGLWSPPRLSTPPTPADPPNILLITIGGLRADRVGLGGYPRPITPRLDDIARSAVVFETAVSPGNASRVVIPSLLTGLPPAALALTNPARELSPEVHTLAEHLLDRGLVTAAMVADPSFASQDLDRGFDLVELWPRQTAASALVDSVRQFILTHARERFFLYLHLNDPLQPFDPPAAARNAFVPSAEMSRFGLTTPFSVSARGVVRGCDRCGGAGGINSAFLGLVSDFYDAEVAGLDEQLGFLFDTLKAADIMDDTVIVVTGTHGELLWDHGHRFGHPKDDLSDAIVRVPLVIKPARGAVDKRVGPQVRTLDLFPTLLELAGLSLPPPSLCSESLGPLLVSSSASLATERVSASESSDAEVFGIRQRGFKLVGTRSGPRAQTLSLFDLERDPREQRDVAAEHADQVERLLLSALDQTVLARAGNYLLVTLPPDARSFRLHVKSSAPLASAEAMFDAPIRLGAARTVFDVAGPLGPRPWRAFRLVMTADATLDVELTVARPALLKVRQTLARTATARFPSKVLADLESRGQPDMVLVSVPAR